MKKVNFIINLFLITILLVAMLQYCFAVDNDCDGLDDADEEYRLNLHAPKLIFHPDEKERPYGIEDWFCKYQINLEKEEYYT